MSYAAQIDTRVSFQLLYRLQGAFEVMLCDARQVQRSAESLREIVAAVSVVHQLEEAVARCRQVIAAKKRAIASRNARLSRQRTAAPRPDLGRQHPYPQARPLAGHPGATAGSGEAAPGGVTGAQPLSAMGHGCPAPVRAGSAAAGSGRSDNAESVQQETARHPAQPLFFGASDEGISKQINSLGGIHYAQ